MPEPASFEDADAAVVAADQQRPRVGGEEGGDVLASGRAGRLQRHAGEAYAVEAVEPRRTAEPQPAIAGLGDGPDTGGRTVLRVPARALVLIKDGGRLCSQSRNAGQREEHAGEQASDERPES